MKPNNIAQLAHKRKNTQSIVLRSIQAHDDSVMSFILSTDAGDL